jgi:hypothetical protein
MIFQLSHFLDEFKKDLKDEAPLVFIKCRTPAYF